MSDTQHTPPQGAQRLSVERLQRYQALRFGMFIHFGMSTYVGESIDRDHPSTTYAPDKLDVDQWVQVARDAGMTYAVLTAKHSAGHCLWPSDHTDYGVATSGNRTDVVGAFVEACRKHGLAPGLYYTSMEEHHVLGSMTPRAGGWGNAWVSHAMLEFQMRQVEELVQRYGPVEEFWIDLPFFQSPQGRNLHYEQLARLMPEGLVILNQGFGSGDRVDTKKAWPTDVMATERVLPAQPENKHLFSPWFRLDLPGKGPLDYYIPAEHCDTIGADWFWTPEDRPRSDAELLGMALVVRERGCNFLLDVPPDRHGVIPESYVESLRRLRKNLDRFP